MSGIATDSSAKHSAILKTHEPISKKQVITMGLSTTKEEQLRKMPQIDFRVLKSKDGKFLIHKTTITDIKPFNYYKKIVENPDQIEGEAVSS
jgi:hypothetical protein